MIFRTLSTECAPAERASGIEIGRELELLRNTKLLPALLDALGQMTVVVNRHRQVVFANRAFVQAAGLPASGSGLRAGELLGCVHSLEGPSGCGTSRLCQCCGWLGAILDSQQTRSTVSRECHFTRLGGEALDLEVTAAPIPLDGADLTLVSIRDISSEKRRAILERVFFHDLLNTAWVVSSLAQLLETADEPGKREHYVQRMSRSAALLFDELLSHKLLAEAERGELLCKPKPIRSRAFLETEVSLYREHTLARERTLTLAGSSEDVEHQIDPGLLSRVLGNMIRNGLEACAPGQTVTARCSKEAAGVLYAIHNPGFMPPVVQLQVFHRSFSTKGEGRGIGTYSMKLLGEKYLGGKLAFETNEREGTTFLATFPLAT